MNDCQHNSIIIKVCSPILLEEKNGIVYNIIKNYEICTKCDTFLQINSDKSPICE